MTMRGSTCSRRTCPRPREGLRAAENPTRCNTGWGLSRTYPPRGEEAFSYCLSRLLGLLDDLDETVVLVLGQRTGLLDADQVADTGGVLLIVSLDLLVGAKDLAVQSVLLTILELDHDGLLHLVRNHVAGANLACALFLVVHVCLTHN